MQEEQQKPPFIPTSPPAPVVNSDPNYGLRTLWMGSIPYNWNEETVFYLFPPEAELLTVYIVRNKINPEAFCYAFLNFTTYERAKSTLLAFHNFPLPQTDFVFHLNWAVVNNNHHIRSQRKPYLPYPPSLMPTPDPLSLFVGDLHAEVTESELLEAFQTRFPSVSFARIVMDPIRNVPKGYGFVKFNKQEECDQALREEVVIHGQPVRVKYAQNRQHQYNRFQPDEQENTTVFVGNLSPSITSEQLQAHFLQQHLGEDALVSVKILTDRSCGFVRFSQHEQAKQAIASLNGTMLSGLPLRLNWGRKQSDMMMHQQQQQPQQQQQQQPAQQQQAGTAAMAYYPQQQTQSSTVATMPSPYWQPHEQYWQYQAPPPHYYQQQHQQQQAAPPQSFSAGE